MPRITAVFSFIIIELSASLTNHRPYYSALEQINPDAFMSFLRTWPKIFTYQTHLRANLERARYGKEKSLLP